MKNRKPYWFIFFLIGSVVEVTNLTFELGYSRIWFKPLIMLGLIGHYWNHSPKQNRFFMIALTLCWVGDILLIFDQQSNWYFIGGLFAFLIGHLNYIISYQQLRFSNVRNKIFKFYELLFLLLLIVLDFGMLAILYPTLGDMKIPTTVYTLTISIMVFFSFSRNGLTSSKSFRYIFIGALLFLLSDSLLAINLFYRTFSFAQPLIMFSYCSAQLLIVKGVLAHEKLIITASSINI